MLLKQRRQITETTVYWMKLPALPSLIVTYLRTLYQLQTEQVRNGSRLDLNVGGIRFDSGYSEHFLDFLQSLQTNRDRNLNQATNCSFQILTL
jgi:hypothetical protein